jgi:acetate kinase
MMDQEIILCLNTGSSSLKFDLYLMGVSFEKQLFHGEVERIGKSGGRLWVRDEDNRMLVDQQKGYPTHRAAVEELSQVAKNLELPFPSAIGHRVVHGGAEHSGPARVDAALLKDLRDLIPFAPLHLPTAIEVIETTTARFPGLPQVACFDTAFHRRMPEVAQRFPLREDLWNEGIRRFGFHGLSYEYIVSSLGPEAKGRMVIAHLGNGASLAAIKDGQPVDTTMGFTPSGGLMMGTRSGDLDPGVLIYLLSKEGYSAAQLEEAVNQRAGLLGVSGISSDMKELLDLRASQPAAARAVELFCYQLRKYIGAMAAALGGLETLVFTGGIGERGALIRKEVCEELRYLGVALDAKKNANNAPLISVPGSPCTVRVIPTQEDLMIARHTYSLVFSHLTRREGLQGGASWHRINKSA